MPLRKVRPPCAVGPGRGPRRSAARGALVLLLALSGAILVGCSLFATQSREEKAAALSQVVLPKTPPSRESQVYYHFILGDLYAQENKVPQAVAEFEQALAVLPDSPSLLLELAQQYYRLAEADKALEMVRKAVRLDPQFKEAYQLLGEMEIALGKWEEASKTFQTLVRKVGFPVI